MDPFALTKLTYGLFVVGVACESKVNACITNTVMQVTAEPMRLAACVAKDNYTHDMMLQKGSFSISVLARSVPMDTIARFGFASGRDKDKFEGFPYDTDCNGNPLLKDDVIAVISCDIIDTKEVDTHTLFIADIADARIVSQAEPLTYAQYHSEKKGTAPKNAPTYQPDAPPANDAEGEQAVYRCTICGYIYDGDIPFEDLPDDYLCPLCKNPKSVFERVK
nr:flavin reductase [Maliibacterium massiliense]